MIDETGQVRGKPHIFVLTHRRLGFGRRLVDNASHERFVAAVAAGHEHEIYDTFMADANAFTWRGDFAHSVLLAAIAVETKVKRNLTGAAAATDKADLLNLIIKNYRDITVSALNLLDVPSRVILGRSLREHDKKLWNAVKRLFEHRNAIAHGKDIPPPDLELVEDVKTAQRILDWLDAPSG